MKDTASKARLLWRFLPGTKYQLDARLRRRSTQHLATRGRSAGKRVLDELLTEYRAA